MKSTIIKFTDVNADGNGTDIEIYVEATGETEITSDCIQKVHKAMNDFMVQEEWDTDSVMNIACKTLESEGYKCRYIVPDYSIEF